MNIKNILLGALASLTAVSCVYDSSSDLVISTDKAVYELDKTGGEATVMLTSTTDWTATVVPATSLDNIEGITISPASGKGSSKPVEVKIIAEANDGTDSYDRGALISFFGDNIATAVTLQQKGSKPRPAEEITIAEFLKKPVDAGVYFRLTGTVTGAKPLGTDDYSNCTLVDETGSVLIYGIGLERGGSTKVKTFETKGVVNGDMLTIETTRGVYSGTPQGAGAYYISHEKGQFAEFKVETKSLAVPSFVTSVSFDVTADDNVAWTVKDGNGFTASPKSGTGNSKVTVSFDANTGNDVNEADIVVSTEANVLTKSYTVSVAQNAKSQDVAFTKAATVESGKKYIMVAKNGALTLPDGKSYGYGDNISVFESEGKLYMVNAASAFLFTAKESGFTMTSYDGKGVFMDGNFNSFNWKENPEAADVWTVEAQGDGTFKITNVEKTKYIQLDSEHGTWGSYADSKGDLPVLYQLAD